MSGEVVSTTLQPSKWRWIQFRLVTLLSAMTVLSVLSYRVGPWVAGYLQERPFIVPTMWDVSTGNNVKWQARLGSVSYGSPVVSAGKVFIGTNNNGGRINRYPPSVDLGVLLCFSESHGDFLWQASSRKLATGRVHDWPLQGVCSTPWVESNRLWYVTNRCEVVCLDTEGFYDGENDGPFSGEPNEDLHEADIVWKFDMMGNLGVSPHNMSACSVVVAENAVFAVTSNAVDQSHRNIPAPDAPSFIALGKSTGSLLWTDNSPGKNILHGQWGSPAYARLGGVAQVMFPGGDGWLYSFDARGIRQGKSQLLWKFDCNPKRSMFRLGGSGTRSNLINASVVYDGLVYITVGQDPEHGGGQGRVWCIDPTKRGDVSAELVFNRKDPEQPIEHKRYQACQPEEGDFTRSNPNSATVWQYERFDVDGDGRIESDEEMNRSLSRVVIKNDLAVVADIGGVVHCLDAKTGQSHWTFDLLASCWSTPLIAGRHIYVGDEDGDVAVFLLSADPQVAMPGGRPVAEMSLMKSIYSSPVAADNVLYVASRSHLYAIAVGNQKITRPQQSRFSTAGPVGE